MNGGGNRPAARVLAVAGDAGGAAALVSVLRRMKEAAGRWEIQVLAYRQARTVFAEAALAFHELGERADEEGAGRWFKDFRPDVLLTATSVNGVDWEKRMVAESRRSGIPSLAVLDFWSNYRARFADERDRLAFLPDRIAVMDDWARTEMVELGFPADRLVVTGQPAFDEWAERKAGEEGEAVAVRVRHAADDVRHKLVLFLSQPISDFYSSPALRARHPGYSEAEVFHTAAEALEQLARKRDLHITLLVRPHPRETWSLAPEGALSAHVKLARVDRDPIRSLLMASDVAVGMTTVLLMEACFLGCVTVSMQPGLRGPDILPANRMGMTFSVYDPADAESVLATALLDDRARVEKKRAMAEARPAQGSARRVLEEIERLPNCRRIEKP